MPKDEPKPKYGVKTLVETTRRDAIRGLYAISTLPLLSNLITQASATGTNAEKRATSRLRFDAPAQKWMEALPVGNGRLGGMCFGGTSSERVQLNHIELWSGRSTEDDRPQSLTALPEVRRLLFAGQYAEANKLAQAEIMTPMNAESYGSYQMLGDLVFSFDHADSVSDYERELDLNDAAVRVKYRIGNAQYKRTILASFPDRVLAVRLETSAPQGLSFSVELKRDKDAKVEPDPEVICLIGQPKPFGTKFAAHLGCRNTGGRVSRLDNGYRVDGAKSVVLFLTGATDLLAKNPIGQSRTVLDKAMQKSWAQLLAAHKTDYEPLFDAVKLELGVSPKDIAADTRLKAVQKGQPDNALTETYFNFGRYLLISSSRPGSLPANLQGLWADGFAPPWSSDYHININLQMNYWPAEVCGLGMLQSNLFDYAERLVPNGRKTARIAYGCRGAAAHYTTNPWGHTALDGQLEWGLWPEGLAWLSLHFWEHYQYTQDKSFLKERAYPFLKSCAEFTLDYLVPDPKTGKLVAGPATSPENTYKLSSGVTGNITMGPAMSQSIAFCVLTHCREAAAILQMDNDFQAQCQSALNQLQRLHIGPDGRIMEWPEPFEEAEPGHRHISHLFGLHPGNEIDIFETPDLAAAARKTLAARLIHGGGHTGWSAAWLIMFRARLGEGDEAHAMLEKLFRQSTSQNYFDTISVDDPIFQIDGNLGATAAIVEMLLQSQGDRLRFLPALPKAWAAGKVKGLRARGNIIVDITWSDGKAHSALLTAANDAAVRLTPPPGQSIASLSESGTPIKLSEAPIRLSRGKTYEVKFDRAIF